MSLKTLPKIEALSGQRWQMREDCLDKWNPSISASDISDRAISVFGVVGDDINSARVGAALRAIGNNDVVVNINSPGGDFFDGVTIYNMLREHKAKVTVRVLGLAASAASVIAMAGDEVQVGKSASIMIHNAWTVAVGNRHDLSKTIGALEVFDSSMAELYAARTGTASAEMAALMDAETWISGTSALSDGFADSFLSSDVVSEVNSEEQSQIKAQAILENALRAHNPEMSRSERDRKSVV